MPYSKKPCPCKECGNSVVDGRTVKSHAEQMARGTRARAPAPCHKLVPSDTSDDDMPEPDSDASEPEQDAIEKMNAFCQEVVELVAEGKVTQQGAEGMLKITHAKLQPHLPEDYQVPCSWYKCRTNGLFKSHPINGLCKHKLVGVHA